MRLIDADALIGEWKEKEAKMSRDRDGAIPVDFSLIISAVSKAPTITLDDLRPHGRWIPFHSEGYNPEYDLWFEWECSNCHNNYANDEDELPYNFCPNCGAKMDLEE